MPGFHYVSYIPTDVDLTNKWLFDGNGVRMLLDGGNGDVYATKCVWCKVYMGPEVPESVRKLFSDDMHGKSLSHLSEIGKINAINAFIDENKDILAPYDPFGVVPVGEDPPQSVAIFDENSWPNKRAGLYNLKAGSRVWFQSRYFEILKVREDESDTYYTLNIPVKSTPFRTLFFYVGLSGDQWKNVEVPASSLMPSDTPGVAVLSFQPFDGWSIADFATFFMTIGVAANIVYGGDAALAMPGMFDYLARAPWPVFRVGGRTWNNWIIAATQGLLLGRKRSTALTAWSVPGGSAGRLMTTVFGSKYIGLAWNGIFSMRGSLPLGAVGMSMLSNYESWPAAASWTRQSALPSITAGALTTMRALPATSRVVLQAGADLIVETGRTGGRVVGAIIGGTSEALPEEMKQAMGSAFRGGTTTLTLVVASLVFLGGYKYVS